MRMDFLPFPRGTSARGTLDGRMVIAPQFLNKKGQPILGVLRGQTELAQVLMGTEFLNKGICRCLKAHNPDCKFSWSIGRNLKRCNEAGFLENQDCAALKAVQDIRNAIAHSDFTIVLSDDEVSGNFRILKDWLESVEHCCTVALSDGRQIPCWQKDLMDMNEWRNDDDQRNVFLGVVLMLFTGLANVQWALNPVSYTGEGVG